MIFARNIWLDPLIADLLCQEEISGAVTTFEFHCLSGSPQLFVVKCHRYLREDWRGLTLPVVEDWQSRSQFEASVLGT